MPVTTLNMHVDLVVTGSANGPVTLTAADASGNRHSVVLPHPLAQKIHAVPKVVAGGGVQPHNMHVDVAGEAGAAGGAVVQPYNMHVDSTVQSSTPSTIVLVGKAGHAGQDVDVRVTIDGPARQQLNGSGI